VNPKLEQQLLGALMVSGPQATQAVIIEVGLKPEHFYLDRHREICEAIYSVLDRDNPQSGPDELLVSAELSKVGSEVTADYVSELCATVNAPGNFLVHARRILDDAEWRRRGLAAGAITEAVEARDREKLTEAEAQLSEDLVHDRKASSPEELREMAIEILEGDGVECFPFPIAKLNELSAGGLRRGEHHVIGGHSTHGKSLWLDQLLAYWAGGFRVHLYMNEMDKRQRVMRLVTKGTKVKYSRLATGQVDAEEADAIRRSLGESICFGITDCTGWSAQEISTDIRRNRWDIAAVDMLHLIPHTKEPELAAISARLTEASRLADCLVVSTVHLNEARTMTAVKPVPTVGDIRGSGMIKNNADSVGFIYRDQDMVTGLPEWTGQILMSKVRNGVPGVVDVELFPGDLTFYAKAFSSEPYSEPVAA
jgi:replicative DNA helicase